MKKVLDFYEKIIGWLEIAFNLLIVGVIGFSVIKRFFFNLPLKFPEEVSAFVLIAMVFVGVSVVERHNEHLRVEFLQDLLPAKGKKAMNIVSRLLTLVLTGGILAGEFQLFPQIKMLKTHAARIPYAWLHIVIIVSTILWAIFAVLGLLSELRKGE